MASASQKMSPGSPYRELQLQALVTRLADEALLAGNPSYVSYGQLHSATPIPPSSHFFATPGKIFRRNR
jgi:hypothetical protein